MSFLRNKIRKQAREIRAQNKPNPEASRAIEIAMLAMFGAMFVALTIQLFSELPDFIQWSRTHRIEFNDRMAFVLPFVVLLVGWLMYQLRERKKAFYAVLELGVAAGTAFSAWNSSANVPPFTSVLAISGAVYIAVRGFDNFYKAESARKKG